LGYKFVSIYPSRLQHAKLIRTALKTVLTCTPSYLHVLGPHVSSGRVHWQVGRSSDRLSSPVGNGWVPGRWRPMSTHVSHLPTPQLRGRSPRHASGHAQPWQRPTQSRPPPWAIRTVVACRLELALPATTPRLDRGLQCARAACVAVRWPVGLVYSIWTFGPVGQKLRWQQIKVQLRPFFHLRQPGI
jgi:hypothetical protein